MLPETDSKRCNSHVCYVQIADSRNCSTASRVEESTKPDVGTLCNMEGNLGTSLDLIPRDESAVWMVVAGN